MNRAGTAYVRLVVFCPHNDVVAPIQDYQSCLFAAGTEGALSFPVCAVLGKTEKPLSRPELKSLAASLRKLRADASFDINAPAIVDVPLEPARTFGCALFGSSLVPSIHVDLPLVSFEPFDAPLLLLAAGRTNVSAGLDERLFPLRFRAGYVANCVFRRAGTGAEGFSYEWEQGLPVWLPK
jgi:hypothetical protein